MGEIDISLSLNTTSMSAPAPPAWLRASNAMPQVRPPSPITATTLRSLPLRCAAIAIPAAAPIDVPACPTPKVSNSLSLRLGNGEMPPRLRTECMRSRRPVRILCG